MSNSSTGSRGKPAAKGTGPTGSSQGKPAKGTGVPTGKGAPGTSPTRKVASGTGPTRKEAPGTGAKGGAGLTTLLPKAREVPDAVRRASRLTLGGAGGTLAWGLYWVIVSLAFRSDVVRNYMKADHLTSAKANAQVNGGVLITVLEVVVFAAVWVLMGRLSREGRAWARIASTLLFVLWSYYTYLSIDSLKTYIGLINTIIMLVIWGFGCAVLVFLWRPESTAYFKGSQPRR